MKCERCSASTTGYDLFDYCVWCSKNLCEDCTRDGKCAHSDSGKHEASAKMTCGICKLAVDDCTCGKEKP